MARTPTTPIQAQRNTREHLTTMREAGAIIAAILEGTWQGDDADRTSAILAAAKTFEAGGCYIRRVNANGLLTA